MSSILKRISSRARFLYLTTDTSEADAKRIAARELGQAAKQRKLKQPSAATPKAESSSLRALLLAKLFDGLGHALKPPAPKPATPARSAPSISERLFGQRPKPSTPPLKQAPLLYTGGVGGATLISDDDYKPGLHCIPAQNLRASIEYNQQLQKHREAQSAAHRNKVRYVG
jgi:hypothetical protein